MRAWSWLFAVALAAAGPAARAQEEAAFENEIVVVGEVLGPSLWRTVGTAGELYILGTVAPLPAKMTWRSQRVDEIIARTNRAIVGDVAVRLKPRELAAGLFTRRDAVRNPDDATLSQQLDPALKARLDARRAALGLSADAFESWRPYVAGAMLLDEALKREGLSTENSPQDQSLKKLRKRGVKVTQAVEFEGGAMLKSLNDMPLGADVTCFEAQLELAENWLPRLKARANAWARGDVARIRAIQDDRLDGQCLASLQAGGVPAAALMETARQRLTKAAADAAATPGVTLMFAPMALLIAPDGVLARLGQAGLTVDGP